MLIALDGNHNVSFASIYVYTAVEIDFTHIPYKHNFYTQYIMII